MRIQVRINEEGALRNQRYAFSDKYTLVTELMQNARRADARRVEVLYDEGAKVLRIIDDGCGIEDFQKLLTFNESGWANSICREERAFGIGFSKCLYSATRCVVVSRGQRIDFMTDAALKREPIEVINVPDERQTVVELHEVLLPGLKTRLSTVASGFPIAVCFNGIEISRIHAIERLAFTPTEIGEVYLTGTQDGKYSTDTLVFLQGFCVMRPSGFDPEHVNVVHLDSQKFMARLPDRDKLIDEEDQYRRIDGCLKSLWRQAVIAAKTELEPEVFVDLFFKAMSRWGHLDLLNTVPLLPKCLCQRIVGYPLQEAYESRQYLEPVGRCLTRSEIEGGRTVLAELDSTRSENVACWMLAKAKGYIVFSAVSLHRDHWAHPYTRVLDDAPVQVDAVGAHCRGMLEGRWIWTEVILCDAVSLTLGDERVEIADEGVYHEGSIFIPAGEASGEPVRQASDFIDEHDQFLYDYRDADRAALADLILRLRATDPNVTLRSLVQGLKLEQYPLLQGKTFRLKVGHRRGEHAVELVA
jgi:hypothetical protein